ncbi:MAG: diaminopimelate decarboxylase [Geminicoccaceae bacterium]|nr:MAG: diaminopimelate decarboxylase [Geminicoccaceae bacterium]
MRGFTYRDGLLHVDDVALDRLVRDHGTPLYVYSAREMRARYRRLAAAFAGTDTLFCYALKANPTLGVVATLAKEGAGADVVSAGELERALAAGIAPERIVFAGVGKSHGEIDRALAVGVLQLNVESVEELHMVAERAAARGLVAPVALRLNPDVAATTHDKIATGRRHDKFGIAGERLGEVLDVLRGLSSVRLVGLHCHIGSQIAVVEDFERAYARMATFYRTARAAGFPLERLNLGGGLGIRYVDERELDIEAFARMALAVTRDLGARLVFEPGRYLVAAAGALLSRVILVKTGSEQRRFVVVDAGMNTLIRPAMYGAVHPIQPLAVRAEAALSTVDVVGPICESSDIFARDLRLPLPAAGDVVAFMNAGAYGAAMASDYNSRGRAAEVLADGDRVAMLKPRLEPVQLFADEAVPAWLRPAVRPSDFA